jgi:DNA replication protein DnaC
MPGVFEFTDTPDDDPDNPDDDSERLAQLIKFSNIPTETRLTERLSTFEEVPGREEGFEASLAFIRGEIVPPLLLLYGLPGTSKTHLATAIGWVFLSQLKSVYYCHVGDLMDDLREGYRIGGLLNHGEFNKDSYDAIMKRVKKSSLLILDDLGVQKDTYWVLEKLDTIIDHRWRNNLPTVATANTLELPERVFDRMREGKVVRLQGESYRVIRQRRKQDADKEGVG